MKKNENYKACYNELLYPNSLNKDNFRYIDDFTYYHLDELTEYDKKIDILLAKMKNIIDIENTNIKIIKGLLKDKIIPEFSKPGSNILYACKSENGEGTDIYSVLEYINHFGATASVNDLKSKINHSKTRGVIFVKNNLPFSVDKKYKKDDIYIYDENDPDGIVNFTAHLYKNNKKHKPINELIKPIVAIRNAYKN